MQTEILTPWAATAPLAPGRRVAPAQRCHAGNGHDVLLQGFHWDSHRGVFDGAGRRKAWYRILLENAEAIVSAGFTGVWFPPPSDSLAPQGYLPRRWDVLDTAYGSEAELRAAIRALAPVRAFADVVLNHRVGIATAGADFEDPAFPDNPAAVTCDDLSGVGTGNRDTGESYHAGRNLDHTNPDVRAVVKDYLRRLKGVGFTGWRYDLVKGYHGRFVGEYNDATGPYLAVGEYFDSDRQKVHGWIEAAGARCAAFDFPTRYLLFDAIREDDYGRLRSAGGRPAAAGLIGVAPDRAVTFLDNHDTEHRRDQEHHYLKDDTRHFPGRTVDMGYAYLLTHPGVPCVFWSHFFDWGEPARWLIRRLIGLRRQAGIHAGSRVEIVEARPGLYAAFVEGRVAVNLGWRAWHPGSGWQPVVEGERFAVWTRRE
jgi:alpha-amylase